MFRRHRRWWFILGLLALLLSVALIEPGLPWIADHVYLYPWFPPMPW
jgi:hypothetical protein